MLLLCLFVASATGCGPEGPTEVLGFPAERGPADFPGISVDAHEGEIPSPGSNGPVWLVAIDGATWDLIRPMMAAKQLPNFTALTQTGAYGVLQSEDPTISPAVWATVATGMPRFEHGIVNFIVKQPGSYDTISAGPPDRRSPAVWELVGAAGGSSAVVSWFGSFPAEEIPGYYLSMRFDPENIRPNQVHPDEFGEQLERDSAVTMRSGDLQQIGWNDSLRGALLNDARTLAALRVIANEAQPDLVMSYFAGVDIVQHTMWRHMDPSSQSFPEDGEPDSDLAEVIPAYYRYIDHTLGEIRDLLPENATLMLVSDHGGGPLRRNEAFHLQLEVLLGLMGLSSEDHSGPAYALGELYRHEKSIWLNLEGVESRGVVPQSRAGEQAESIRDRLSRLTTDTGAPVFASLKVHTSEPAWRPGQPALTVRFSRAALQAASIVDDGQLIDFSPVRFRVPDGSGSHRPEGIVILNGPGIRPGALPKDANIYQVAPTLLHLLGLPQDGRILRHAPSNGGVITAAFDPVYLEQHPVRMVAEYPGTDRRELLREQFRESPTSNDPAHEEAMEKLRSLGYVR